MQRFTDLRAWQACVAYKRAIYRLVLETPLSRDWHRRAQMEESVAGPPSHVAEGYGRFSPPDFARFLVTARASLMESQNHLIDAVDKGYISEETRLDLDALAITALQEVTGLMEYLQSPEALRNARHARERRIASRQERLAARMAAHPEQALTQPGRLKPEPRTSNPELQGLNSQPPTANPEPGSLKLEPRTANPELQKLNSEPPVANPKPRRRNPEITNPEQGTTKPEL